MSKTIYIFLIPLIALPQFGFTQKNIEYYIQKAFPNGFVSEITITDSIIDDELNYFCLSYKDDSFMKPILEARIYDAKTGNDILFINKSGSDMQCEWVDEHIYEIDEKKDSLIPIEYLKIFPEYKYSDFVDAEYIKKNIFPKYADSLKNYLGEDHPFDQFLEELYDIEVYLRSDGSVLIYLLFCDYIPRNLIGFSDEDLNYLTEPKSKPMYFHARKKKFIPAKNLDLNKK